MSEMKPPVIIVSYNPRWPLIYEEESTAILNALGDSVLAIEHIGSTSVPHLGGKNIVDIMAGVENETVAHECILELEELGYTDITPQPGHPEWFYCVGYGSENPKKIHLHIVKYPSDHWTKHILFRDYLRGHTGAAQEYFEIKKRLAQEFGRDREGYTNAKSGFIKGVLKKASGSPFGRS